MRRTDCGHVEAANDQEQRRCRKDGRKLWVKPVVRPVRFQDLRHTTASLLIMSGANLPAVQRILRHNDPKITTEIYAHLAPEYLRAEVDRLSFGKAVADVLPRNLVTRLLPEGRTEKKKAGTRGSKPPEFRPSELERETGAESATLSLGTDFTDSPMTVRPSQVLGNSGGEVGTRFQASQPKQAVFGFLVTPLLPEDVTVGTLIERMVTVREAARLLGVSRATVYELCARGELAYVRLLNAIRITPDALAAVMAGVLGDRG